jgi:hypothetical protein
MGAVRGLGKVLRSQFASVLLVKFWIPLLLAASAIAIYGGIFIISRLFLALPFLMGAAFFASVAIVEIRDGALRYRRLFAWKEIPFGDILNVRIEVPSAIASFRLKRLLFPWVRLYFVLDKNLGANPFHEGEYALLKYIQHRDRKVPEASAEPPSEPNGKIKLFLSASAGAVLYCTAVLLGPAPFQSSSSPSSHTSTLHALRVLYQVAGILTTFKVQLALSLVFTLLAIFRRRDENAWIYAFLAGGSLPCMFLHLLKSV